MASVPNDRRAGCPAVPRRSSAAVSCARRSCNSNADATGRRTVKSHRHATWHRTRTATVDAPGYGDTGVGVGHDNDGVRAVVRTRIAPPLAPPPRRRTTTHGGRPAVLRNPVLRTNTTENRSLQKPVKIINTSSTKVVFVLNRLNEIKSKS